jgi:hypothetical protein
MNDVVLSQAPINRATIAPLYCVSIAIIAGEMTSPLHYYDHDAPRGINFYLLTLNFEL